MHSKCKNRIERKLVNEEFSGFFEEVDHTFSSTDVLQMDGSFFSTIWSLTDNKYLERIFCGMKILVNACNDDPYGGIEYDQELVILIQDFVKIFK